VTPVSDPELTFIAVSIVHPVLLRLTPSPGGSGATPVPATRRSLRYAVR
jgi:hypothetical protein